MLNYYEVLGVPRNASKDEINVACHRMIRSPLAFEISRTLLDDAEKAKYNKVLDGEMVIQQTPVPWGSYAWRDTNHSGLEEKVRNNNGLIAKATLSVVSYIFLVIISAITLSMGNHSGLSMAQLAVCAIWLFSSKMKPRIITKILFAMWTLGLTVWTLGSNDLGSGTQITATAFALAVLGVGFLMNHAVHNSSGEGSKVSMTTRIPAKHVLNHYQWGVAGNLQDALGKFGYENIHKGETGEKYTEVLLENFDDIPGVRVFHGLKFPGSRNADVDHAIMFGDNLIFIDSKQWSSGDYWWEGDGNISQKAKNGKMIKRETSFGVAVGRYKAMLPKRINIYAVILVHGENVRILNNPEFSGTTMANTADGIGIIGQLVMDGVTDGSINHVLMNSLASSLK